MAVPVASLPDTGDTPFVFGIRAHIPLNKGGGWNVPGLPVWSAAVRRMLAGYADAILAGVGDSITAGAQSNATRNLWRQNGYPPQLAGLLSAAGIPATSNNAFGSASTQDETVNAWDSRITFTGTWIDTYITSGFTLGGRLSYLAGSAGTLSFSAAAGDTINLWYPSSSVAGAGTFTVNVDGGASLGTFTETTTNAFNKTTLTVPLGAHVVNIPRATGNVAFIGWDVYNSASKSVRVLNLGMGGAKAADWAYSLFPWSPAVALPRLEAHLTIPCNGTNDWIAGTSLASFEADYRTLIAAARTTGDVVLWTPFPTNNAVVSLATQATYVNVIRSLGVELGLIVVDVWAHFGSWEAANAAGYTGDNYHPSNSGYAVIAGLLKAAITPAA